ncbi:MAG: hypothetical protein ACKVP0_05830 [Pirellulaceae bacterium]
MSWYVYKCNSRSGEHQNHYGDWESFFTESSDGQPTSWGCADIVPKLKLLNPGDRVLAYQTDRNELLGSAEVEEWKVERGRDYVYLRPLVKLHHDGVKVRELKSADARIAEIWAFKTREIKTLYEISDEDAEYILNSGKEFCGYEDFSSSTTDASP